MKCLDRMVLLALGMLAAAALWLQIELIRRDARKDRELNRIEAELILHNARQISKIERLLREPGPHEHKGQLEI